MKRFTLTTRFLLFVCAAVFLVCGAGLLMNRAFSVGYLLLLALYLLFVRYFRSANRLYTEWGMMLRKKHGVSGELHITEAGIGTQTKLIPYAELHAAYLVSDCLYLQPKRGAVILLPARCFADGELEQLADFLEKSTDIGLKRVTF